MTSRVSPASLVRPWDSAGRMRTLSQLLSWPLCSPETEPTEENTKRNVSLHLVWEILHVLGGELWLGMYLCLVEGMALMELPPHELSTTCEAMEHHGNSAPSRPASECFRVLLSLPEPSVRAWMRVKWAPSLEKASPRSGNKSLSCSDTNAQKIHYLWI